MDLSWYWGFSPYKEKKSNASVTIGDATITGRNVSITTLASTAKTLELTESLAYDTRAVVLGDVNGDSYPDLIQGNYDGPLLLHLHNGTSNPFQDVQALRLTNEVTADPVTSLALGDVTGDGLPDLVVGTAGLANHSKLYVNDGDANPFDGTVYNVGPASGDTRAVALADFNGDGLLDLVLGNHGQFSTLYINDRAKAGNFNYLLTPTSLTNEANPDQPGLTRPFAGVFYDGTMESVRLDGTDQANVFDVQPSLSTKFYIDGNLPAPGTVIPDEGDYLKLDTETTHTRGRHLNITARGAGSWTFTSRHKPVEFESIEKFNHVDIVAVGADAGRKSKPRVRVYDAETMELKFEFLAYRSSHAGGVRAAAGDIDLDGLPDVVTVPGERLAPEVRVFNGSPMADATGVELVGLRIAAKRTYGASFAYGAQVAVGDVNGDGCPDIVTAPSRGACTVKVFQSSVFTGGSFGLARSFNAFRDIRGYQGGGTLAVADLDGKSDGNRRADVLVASGSGMPAMVRVFDVAANASSY